MFLWTNIVFRAKFKYILSPQIPGSSFPQAFDKLRHVPLSGKLTSVVDEQVTSWSCWRRNEFSFENDAYRIKGFIFDRYIYFKKIYVYSDTVKLSDVDSGCLRLNCFLFHYSVYSIYFPWLWASDRIRRLSPTNLYQSPEGVAWRKYDEISNWLLHYNVNYCILLM